MRLVPRCQSRARQRFGSRQRGLSLIEVAFAVVIVAVGVTAITAFFTTASRSNSQLEELNTGIILATSAQNWANNQRYSAIEGWLTTAPTGPAIAADLVARGWTQAFSSQRVSLANLQNTSTNTDDKCIRVRVTIRRGTRIVYIASRLYTPGFR